VGKFVFIAALVVGLPALAIAGWLILANTSPGTIGTPAHAGVVSNGRPQDCTTVNMVADARGSVEYVLLAQQGQIVRGTFEANGGFGRVDIMMRLMSPNQEEMLVTPREHVYDFQFATKADGGYTFIFDNRYSLVTKKAIALYYCIPNSGGP
jgi:hypothetical protein